MEGRPVRCSAHRPLPHHSSQPAELKQIGAALQKPISSGSLIVTLLYQIQTVSEYPVSD
jgi:hypothetical protein